MAGRKPYLIVNYILAGIIGFIFIYSGFFSAQKDNYPVPSFFEEITGQPAPSSGMSKAFSEIMRGDMDSAREFNPDSPLIFAFFLIQGIQRILVSILLVKFLSPGPIQSPGRSTVPNTVPGKSTIPNTVSDKSTLSIPGTGKSTVISGYMRTTAECYGYGQAYIGIHKRQPHAFGFRQMQTH